MLRWLLVAPFAAAVAAALFYMMALAIKQPVHTDPPVVRPEIVITAKRELPPDTPRDPPETLNPPEPIDIQHPDKQPAPTGKGGGSIDAEPFEFPQEGGPGVPITPTIVVAPQYPEACRSRNAEGVVVVAFDVNPDGSVTNARIVESTNHCFDRTVLRAVERWKYPPDLSTGEARVRRGVTERFVFELDDA